MTSQVPQLPPADDPRFSFVVEVQPDWNLLGCNLVNPGSTLIELYPDAPEDSMLYLHDPEKGYTIINFLDGAWTEPDTVITPGTGYWFRSPGHTWLAQHGTMSTGMRSIELAAGYNLVSCPVTRSGLITTDLGYRPDDGDMVYQYVPKVPDDPAYPGYFVVSTFDGMWLPKQPMLGIGSGIWIRRANPGQWTSDTLFR